MKKHFTLWAAACILFTGSLSAQAPKKRTCGTVAVIEAMDKADPGFKARRAQNEAAIASYIKNSANQKSQGGPATKFIPVVFHVVYKTLAQNVPDSWILQQVERLNNDFRRTNADTINDPVVFRSLGGDTGIEFGLATIDPNGAPTTGITRTATSANTFSVSSPNTVKSNATGGKSPWPRDNYLNIWVCNLDNNILGYATPPGGPAGSDGVVLLYTSLPGSGAAGAPYNLGRTATHEVGHFLNLRHIWADEPGCADDDGVIDTPQQREENYGCPTFPLTAGAGRSCTAGSPGAMFMNYMDYTDDACMHMFTKGQRTRMLAALNTSRPTLLTSAQTRTFIANFSASNTNVPTGTSVTFSNTSTGSPTGYSWSFPGAVTPTSTAQNPTVVYNTPGLYNVTLTITKGALTNTRTITKYINVGNTTCPPPVVGFTPVATTTICSGSTVSFNSGATTGAASFLWSFPGGTPSSSTSPNPTVTYNTPGTYGVTLDATSAQPCGSTSNLTRNNIITVGAAPNITVNPGTVTQCAPGPITLTASGATTYSWSPATGLNKTTGASVVASPTVTTLYTVTGTSNGCTSTQTVAYVVTNPQANFTANPLVADLKTSGLVTFTNTSTNSLFYSWNFGDPGSGPANNTSTLQHPTHTYTTPGTYTVTLTSNKSGCQSPAKTLNIIVTNTTGLQNAYEAGAIKIYPNPAKNFLQVEVPERENVTEICLVNAIGRTIAAKKPVSGQAQLNVSALPAGMYFVKISNAEGSIMRKVTVTQ